MIVSPLQFVAELYEEKETQGNIFKSGIQAERAQTDLLTLVINRKPYLHVAIKYSQEVHPSITLPT